MAKLTRIRIFRFVCLFTVVYILLPICEYVYGKFACECPITGTNLKAGDVYIITHSSSKYPRAHLTTPTMKDWMFSKVELANTVNNTSLWTGGPVPQSMQWHFTETEQPGWYYLRNAQFPYSSASWLPTDELNPLRYPMVLMSHNQPTLSHIKHSRMDFFIRPYRPKGVKKDTYQFKLKTKPMSIIKWFNPRLASDDYTKAVPMEIDMREPEDLVEHQNGGKLFEETLYTFHELPEKYRIAKTASANSLKVTGLWMCLALSYYIVVV